MSKIVGIRASCFAANIEIAR